VKESGKLRTEKIEVKRQQTENYHEKMKKALVANEQVRKKGMGMYGSGARFHDTSNINKFQGGLMRTRGEQQPSVGCSEYDHRTSKSKRCKKNANLDLTATAAKRCTACNRQGHTSLKSKHCPKHTASLPSNEMLTVTGHVAGSSEGVSEQPSVNDHSTEQIIESDFVGKEGTMNFGTVATTSTERSCIIIWSSSKYCFNLGVREA
jgi:hypothetical protein